MKKFKKYLPLFTMSAVLTVGLFLCPSVLAEGVEPIGQLPDGGNIVSWLLTLAGNGLIIFLIIMVAKTFVTQRWGLFIALLFGGAVAAWIIYFTDSFIGILKAIASAFSG